MGLGFRLGLGLRLVLVADALPSVGDHSWRATGVVHLAFGGEPNATWGMLNECSVSSSCASMRYI